MGSWKNVDISINFQCCHGTVWNRFDDLFTRNKENEFKFGIGHTLSWQCWFMVLRQGHSIGNAKELLSIAMVLYTANPQQIAQVVRATRGNLA